MRAGRPASTFLKRLAANYRAVLAAGDSGGSGPPVTFLEARLIELRGFLEKGVLLRPGGIGDQHPLYVDAMSALMSAEAEWMQEQRKRQG